MSKFCPMCNQVTNCTENCKDCISEEKLYTFFAWGTDNEGGYGVCKRERFRKTPGCAKEKIGDFNTLEELIDLMLKEDPDDSFVAIEAKSFMDSLLEI